MSEVEKFYDEFAVRQQKAGINHRHLSIQRRLEHFGLSQNSRVLEVGCGVGTVTELILRFLDSEGFILATDISPESVRVGKERLNRYCNLDYKVHDFTKETVDGEFDVIVLPDVIEHIPIYLHKVLFHNLGQLLNDNGFILIHIPDPNHLEWCIQNEPENLQIVDQPVHTHLIAENIKESGLYIHFLESYSIYNRQPDYQVIILKKIPGENNYTSLIQFLNDSTFRKIKKKLKWILRGGK